MLKMNKKTFQEKVEPIIAIVILCLLLVGFGVVSEYSTNSNENTSTNIEQQEK